MIAECIGLFAAGVLSASLIPLQSEGIFVGLLLAGNTPAWALLAAASTGNTLGSVLNWWLGRHLARFEGKRWFPLKKPALARAEAWFARWGAWVLLLSWLPIVGDPLTLAAGVLRMRLVPFLAVVALAKTARYALLLAAAS